jgi:uncharacterized protein (DUF1330 family)
MKTDHKIALALVVGLAVGESLVQVLHAQATPPAYAVIDISSFTDPTGYKALLTKTAAANAAFGGTIPIQTQNTTALQGTAPARFVVVKFDNLAKAKAWSASAAQKEIVAIREKTTKSRAFLVEGWAQ